MAVEAYLEGDWSEEDPAYNDPSDFNPPTENDITYLERTVTVYQVGVKNWIYSPYGTTIDGNGAPVPIPLIVGLQYGPSDAKLREDHIPGDGLPETVATIKITDPETQFSRILTATTADTDPQNQNSSSVSVGGGQVVALWDGLVDSGGGVMVPLSPDSVYEMEVTIHFENLVMGAYADCPFTYKFDRTLMEKILQNWPPAAPTVPSIENVNEDQLFIDPNIDPVYLSTGEFYLPEVDLHVPGAGFDFIWSRHYRSRLQLNSAMGHGWDFSYNVALEFIKNAQNSVIGIRLIDGAGGRSVYAKCDDDVFRNGGTHFEIRADEPSAGLYTLFFSDDGQWQFNAGGQLSKIIERNQVGSMDLNYDGQGRLANIKDTVGRYVGIHYGQDSDLIAAVKVYKKGPVNGAAPSESELVRSVEYTYYGENDSDGPLGYLKSVKRSAALSIENATPQNLELTYKYTINQSNPELNGNLTEVIDAKGQHILTNYYAATGDSLPDDPNNPDDEHTTIGGDALSPSHLYFDRIIGQDWGKTALPDMESIALTYERVSYNGFSEQYVADNSVNAPFVRVKLLDRESHVKEYIYDRSNHAVNKREYTGKFQPQNPLAFFFELLHYGETAPTNKIRASDPDYFQNCIAWTNASQMRHIVYPLSNDDPNTTADERTLRGRVEVYLYDYDYASATGYRYRNNLVKKLYLPQDAPETASYLNAYYGNSPEAGVAYARTLTRTTIQSSANITMEEYVYNEEASSCSCGSQVKFATDQNGLTRRFVYDENHNLSYIIYPKDDYDQTGISTNSYYVVQVLGYDNYGRIAEQHLPARYAGSLDLMNPLQTLTESSFSSSDFQDLRADQYVYYPADINTYPGAGSLHQVIIDSGGLNLTSTFEYDGAGVIKKVTSPKGNYIENDLNKLGWPLRTRTSPVFPGYSTTYESRLRYDKNGNVAQFEQSNIKFDRAGNLVDVSGWAVDPEDAERPITYNHYDELNNLANSQYQYFDPLTTSPAGGGQNYAVRITRDKNHRPTLYESPLAIAGGVEANNETQIVYDERGLVFLVIQNPNSSTAAEKLYTEYRYTPEGNLEFVRVGPDASTSSDDRESRLFYDGNARLIFALDSEENYRVITYRANTNLIAANAIFGEKDKDNGVLDCLADPPESTPAEEVVLVNSIYEYDNLNRVKTVTKEHNPDGIIGTANGTVAVTTLIYEPDSRLDSIKDAGNRTTSYTYDSARRLDTITDALQNSVHYTYDLNSNVTLVTTTDKSQVTTDADVVSLTAYTYDNLDRLMSVTEDAQTASARTSTYRFDSRGNLAWFDPAGGSGHQLLEYDLAGRLFRRTDNISVMMDNTITPQPAWTSDVVTTFEYDLNHRLTKVTDPNGNATQYLYDPRNRAKKVIYADATFAEVTAFSNFGEPLTVKDPNGTVVANTYDKLGRLTKAKVVTWTSSTSVLHDVDFEEFTYDGASRLRYAKNGYEGSGSPTYQSTDYFAYNGLSNVVQEGLTFGDWACAPAASTGEVLTAAYDQAGARTQLNYPSHDFNNANWQSETRDALYRVGRVDTGVGAVTGTNNITCNYLAENTYRGGGLLRQRKLRNFTGSEQTYDNAGRPLVTTHQFGLTSSENCYTQPGNFPSSPVTFDSITSIWDSSNRRDTRNRAANSALAASNRQFRYDSMDRLYATVTNNAVSNIYYLDGTQNRTSVVNGAAAADYMPRTQLGSPSNQYKNTDALNRYTSVTGTDTSQTRSLYYDANGNVLSHSQPRAREDSFSYDFRNRLVRVVHGINFENWVTFDYKYDALGRLISSRRGPQIVGQYPPTQHTVTQYRYDGWRLIEERLVETQSGAISGEASLRKLYFYGSDGIDDVVMMRVFGGATPVDYFYHKDDMGNVLALTDKDGAVVEYYEYTDYGYPTIYAPNGTVRTVSAVGNTLLWGARPWDREAGLYYFRYRWYDPALGRFITRDPIGIWGDGINNGNGYAYVGNTPWSLVDPLGLTPFGTGIVRKDCPTILDWDSQSESYFGPFGSRNYTDPTGAYDPYGIRTRLDGTYARIAVRAGAMADSTEEAIGAFIADPATTSNAWLDATLSGVSGPIFNFLMDPNPIDTATTYATETLPARVSALRGTEIVDGGIDLVIAAAQAGAISRLAPSIGCSGAITDVNGALTPSSAIESPFTPNFVYRGLKEGEDPLLGLTARFPGAGNNEMSHVAGKIKSQWISTTKDSAIALEKYGKNGVVRIDLDRVNTPISDISKGFPEQPGMMHNFAKKDKEVLIQDYVPPQALKRVK